MARIQRKKLTKEQNRAAVASDNDTATKLTTLKKNLNYFVTKKQEESLFAQGLAGMNIISYPDLPRSYGREIW